MSKDNMDKPDEYENIFDESHVEKSHDTPKIIDVIDEVNPSQHFTAQPLSEDMLDIDSVYKKESSDLVDEDIEDGIFAPERKPIKSSKKSSSLMWSVSILAIVGVAGFVYFSNPDILSKVNDNIASGNDIILPQEIPSEVADVGISAPMPTPEINKNAIPSDLVIPQVENEVVIPSDVQPEQVITTEQNLNPSVPLEPPKDLTVQMPVDEIVAIPAEVKTKNVKSELKDVPLLTSQIPDAIPSPPIQTEPVVVSEKTPVVPTTLVQAPAIEKKDEVIAREASNKVTAEAEKDTKPKEIVALNSKEEQKVLDDAKLDKYFDSPNGKMLKDIPAPSMDPKKGSSESIIIVNKKGQINSADHSSKKLSIEMTSLNQQTINANRAVKLGRYEAAKEMYDNLYRLNPKDESILSGRALVLQKIGQEDQAISAYEQLLKLYPDNVDAIINLSGLIRKQYPAIALNKLLDLHMNHPNNVFVTAQLGITYADAGNYVDAIRYLNSASTMDPKNAQHAYNLAVVLEKAGKPREAIQNYEKALEIDSIFGEGKKSISREKIYDRLAQLRRN